MLAQSPEPEAHDTVLDKFQIELEFGNVGFGERGKSEDPEKNLTGQRRKPTTNSTHI